MTRSWSTNRPPRTTSRWLSAVAALALLAAGCGSDNADEIFGNQTSSTDTTVATNDGVTAADASDAQLTPDELSQVTAFYQQFLTVADSARTGDATAATKLTELASPAVLAQVDAWRTENEAMAAQDVSTLELHSASNVLTISGSPEAVVLHDCVEEAKVRDVFNLNTVQFVDQLVTISRAGSSWLVANVTVRNDGTLGSGSLLGCVPEYHRARVAKSAADFVAALEAVQGKPAEGLTPELLALVADDLVPEMRAGVEQQVTNGWYLAAKADYGIEVLGSDIQSGGRVFVVGICSSYPEGGTARSLATDEILPDESAPRGAAIYREYKMRTTATDGGQFVDRVIELQLQDVDSNCGGGI